MALHWVTSSLKEKKNMKSAKAQIGISDRKLR